MKACRVPEWYIKSCQKIKYLFPKAHAAAYVVMAFRIAYFKVHHPAAFYASYFSLKADFIDANYIDSLDNVENRQEELERIISIKRDNGETVSRDQNEYSVLEVAREACLRGIKILPPRYSKSEPDKFVLVDENTLLAPYVTIVGLGGTVAAGLKKAFEERPFSSIEDICNRTSINSTVLETATRLGFFEKLPKTEHIDLFAE
jgi:DNA polymerase-3 subunit alpha (Gram-positive type)